MFDAKLDGQEIGIANEGIFLGRSAKGQTDRQTDKQSEGKSYKDKISFYLGYDVCFV